jgi:hypothetical protein
MRNSHLSVGLNGAEHPLIKSMLLLPLFPFSLDLLSWVLHQRAVGQHQNHFMKKATVAVVVASQRNLIANRKRNNHLSSATLHSLAFIRHV